MSVDVNRAIEAFIERIDKGPFKYLKDCEDKRLSSYIEEKNNSKKTDKSVIDYAVYQAWLDMCRTLRIEQKLYSDIRLCISNGIHQYFDGEPLEQKEFDEWFYKLAEKNKDLTVGQFQKIVNMAFKYLFCCDDYRYDRYKYFKWCHMPLDGFTLSWYNGNTEEPVDNTAWSTIQDKDTYRGIVKNIRDLLSEKVVLECEFVIWPREKQRQVCSELRRCMESLVAEHEHITEIDETIIDSMQELLRRLPQK